MVKCSKCKNYCGQLRRSNELCCECFEEALNETVPICEPCEKRIERKEKELRNRKKITDFFVNITK